jgi:hypothetical protein
MSVLKDVVTLLVISTDKYIQFQFSVWWYALYKGSSLIYRWAVILFNDLARRTSSIAKISVNISRGTISEEHAKEISYSTTKLP